MITDMYDAIDRIVKASTLPLSIIIVGVGDADFSAMVSHVQLFTIFYWLIAMATSYKFQVKIGAATN